MSKYSHFEMCEKTFGQKYKWNEQEHNYEPYSRTDMWNKMIEQQDKISDLEAKLKALQNGIIDDETLNMLVKEHKLYKDLEAKLAESERKLEEYKKCNCKECMTDYEKNLNQIIDKYLNENIKIKQQLEEKEKENKTLKDIRTLERVVPRNAQLHKLSNRDCYLKGFENAISETIRTFEETYGKEKCKLIEERDKYLMDIVKAGGYEYQIEELKQQLAESEKERHEEWKTGKEWKWEWQKVNQKLEKAEQDKISFAVEKLEQVKETAECVLDNALKNSSLNQSYYDRLLDEIDNQINELMGEKK